MISIAAVAMVSAFIGQASATAIRGSSPVENSGCSSSPDADYLMLVEQWPAGACDQFGCNVTTDYFTLHGMWPNNDDGSYPCNCDGESFNPNDISDLKDEMDKYWRSFNGNNEDFWQHEWSKHGEIRTHAKYAYYLTLLSRKLFLRGA